MELGGGGWGVGGPAGMTALGGEGQGCRCKAVSKALSMQLRIVLLKYTFCFSKKKLLVECVYLYTHQNKCKQAIAGAFAIMDSLV